MDKTVEVIVVAMVTLVAGLIGLYLASGQADGFGSFADSQQKNAECSYYEERLSRACQGEEADSIRQNAPEECELDSRPRECDQER